MIEGPASPSEVLKTFFVVDGLLGDYDATEWPSFFAFMPDDKTIPNNVVCIYDEDGKAELKSMRSNDVVEHPKVEIHARATTYSEAYAKLKSLQDALDRYRYSYTKVGDYYYAIINATRKGTIKNLGQATGTQRRFIAAMTYNLTLMSADTEGTLIEGEGSSLLHALVHETLPGIL